jgi:hypothetical protein
MSAATTEELWASYEELGTLRAVCERHGLVSRGALSERLHRAGHTLHRAGANRRSRRYSIEQLDRLVEMNGSYAATARIIGSTPDAVRMRITRAREAGRL